MPIRYRFFSAQTALQSIETKRLRVGRIAELNDPFDCMPYFVGANADQSEACEKMFNQVLAARNESRGLLCFTETWREPVLWRHYADHHRGIALAFSFKRARTDLIPVQYRTQRPPIPYEAILNPARDAEVQYALTRSHYVKSKTWSYEKESRLILQLNKCSIAGGSYFMGFDKTFFKGVILGLRCTASIMDVRRTCDFAGFPHVRIWRAVKSADGFALVREAGRATYPTRNARS